MQSLDPCVVFDAIYRPGTNNIVSQTVRRVRKEENIIIVQGDAGDVIQLLNLFHMADVI